MGTSFVCSHIEKKIPIIVSDFRDIFAHMIVSKSNRLPLY